MSTLDGPDEIETLFSVEDELFDLVYPPWIRELSARHWTPVVIARKAAEFLVAEPGTRVLDIGCGPGKFCMVGALATAGHFTGVEQRKHLASLALDTIKQEQIPNAEIIHTNVTAIDFSAYGAYYLFNPFEENLFKMGRIDSSLELSMEMYNQYTRHVAGELARVPLGTRVATYCGLCDEIPAGYKCEESHFDDALKFWRKTKE